MQAHPRPEGWRACRRKVEALPVTEEQQVKAIENFVTLTTTHLPVIEQYWSPRSESGRDSIVLGTFDPNRSRLSYSLTIITGGGIVTRHIEELQAAYRPIVKSPMIRETFMRLLGHCPFDLDDHCLDFKYGTIYLD